MFNKTGPKFKKLKVFRVYQNVERDDPHYLADSFADAEAMHLEYTDSTGGPISRIERVKDVWVRVTNQGEGS